MAKQSQSSQDIRIRQVPEQVHIDLVNISKNLGVTLTGLLKPKLRDIADSYRPELKKPIKD